MKNLNETITTTKSFLETGGLDLFPGIEFLGETKIEYAHQYEEKIIEETRPLIRLFRTKKTVKQRVPGSVHDYKTAKEQFPKDLMEKGITHAFECKETYLWENRFPITLSCQAYRCEVRK